MINSFIDHLQYEKRYSVHTIEAYQNDLSQFAEFFTGSPTDEAQATAHATHADIRAWIISLAENDVTPRSINRKLATLRSYYKYLMLRQAIATNPMLKIKALKAEKRLPSFVKEQELDKLLDSNIFADDFFGWRDRAIIEILYGTGMRQMELLQLNDHDIDLNNATVKVLGKRNKERIIPFSKPLAAVIKSYLAAKNAHFKGNCSPQLIVNNSGRQPTPALIYNTVKHYLTHYTTTDKKSPHTLRHTYATHLLNNGAELNAVKDLLGHSSLAATQVYTHNTLKKLKSVFDQAHPKA